MLPRVILHNSVSLDGRIDVFTPNIGLHYEIASHFKFDAHLTGSETIFSSDEEILDETVEDFDSAEKVKKDKRKILVIPDSRGRLRNWHGLRRSGYWRDFVALVSNSTPKRYLSYLEKRHIDYIKAGTKKVDLRAALNKLNTKYNVRSVLLDGGGILNGVMLSEGLVSEISLLIHPALVGGATPLTIYSTKMMKSTDNIIDLKLKHFEKLKGGIIWVRYTLK